MRAEADSRAIRTMAAELASLADDDLHAILAELDIASRERLLGLIAAFRQGDAPFAPAAPEGPAAALSPWLVRRLEGDEPALAPHALTALREAAAAVGWVRSPPARPAPERPGLLARLGLVR